jgi:poly-gamma-glutamate synthesis protein (capsule biosynthesis protein)
VITFVGDILLAGGAGRVASAKGTEHLFAGVSDLLRADDLTIGNLECAFATRGTRARKQFAFCASPALLPGLRKSGIDAVSLANNHSLDYGRAALLETIRNLRRAGLRAAGAGASLYVAGRPVILRAGQQRVGFVAASRVLPSGGWRATPHRPGIFPAYDPEPLIAAIRAVRANVNAVVVYLHWGRERAIRPYAYQRTLARQCIDAGADVVVGAHPHVLQGFEYYRGRLIAYSLGNFVFTDQSNASAMLRVTFRGGKLQKAAVVPCRILRFRPQTINDRADRRRAFRALEARSFGVRISEDGVLCARDSPRRS